MHSCNGDEQARSTGGSAASFGKLVAFLYGLVT